MNYGDKKHFIEELIINHEFSIEVVTETAGSWTITMAAEVGLLTRNIKIIGNDYSKLASESFGARVVVGTYNSGLAEFLG